MGKAYTLLYQHQIVETATLLSSTPYLCVQMVVVGGDSQDTSVSIVLVEEIQIKKDLKTKDKESRGN
jgi:hypothetical protein